MFKIGDTVKIISLNGDISRYASKSIIGQVGKILEITELSIKVYIPSGVYWYLNQEDLEKEDKNP